MDGYILGFLKALQKPTTHQSFLIGRSEDNLHLNNRRTLISRCVRLEDSVEILGRNLRFFSRDRTEFLPCNNLHKFCCGTKIYTQKFSISPEAKCQCDLLRISLGLAFRPMHTEWFVAEMYRGNLSPSVSQSSWSWG